MAFVEVTAVNYRSEEVMLNINVNSGKLMGLYVYKDFTCDYYSERADDFLPIANQQWQPKQNSAFMHCPPCLRKAALTRIIEGEFAFSPETQEEAALISKLFTRYAIPADYEHLIGEPVNG